MPRLVYVVFKDRQRTLREDVLDRLSARLQPDNIETVKATRFGDDGVVGIVFPPNPAVAIRGSSACLGKVFGGGAWHTPLREYADGSYALFRSDERCTEIVSDVVGSRTIWYFHDDEIFIAATSQRAIIGLLGSFVLNECVVPWMLSAGTLGPGDGWDARLRRLPPDSAVILNRQTWVATQRSLGTDEFAPKEGSDAEHERLLSEALHDTFRRLDLDYDHWVLPLSGGYDSRGILCLLENKERFKTITWGRKSARREKASDAYVAQRLAERCGLEHRYYETDDSATPPAVIYERFFRCGEGRTDRVSGYMDGFQIWKNLYETGVHGVIRGDEAFGWKPATTPWDVRSSVGATVCSDFANLAPLAAALPRQELPEALERRAGESLSMWRDRLYHQYRIPLVLAALNDLKAAYVEVVNPLLARRLIRLVRTTPDHLRTDKYLLKRVVTRLGPDVPFARYAAIAQPKHIFESRATVELVKDSLSATRTGSLLPQELVDHIRRDLNPRRGLGGGRILRAAARRLAPLRAAGGSKSRGAVRKPTLPLAILAFRAYLIVEMCDKLTEDAAALQSS